MTHQGIITAIAKGLEASYGYQYFESYLVIFILYIVICGVIQWGFKSLRKTPDTRIEEGEIRRC